MKRLITLDPLIEILAIPSRHDRESQIALIHANLRQCRSQDALIVDTFPRGLAGELINELPTFDCLKVLIHRDLNPNYVEQKQLEQAVDLYDLVIVPGEDAPLQQLGGVRTPTWTICNADEMLSRSEARRVFGIPDNDSRPLVTLIGSGTEDESIQAARLTNQLRHILGDAGHVRLAALNAASLKEAGDLGIPVWPLLVTHAGIDLLIGAGGYNTVHGTRATKTTLLAIPQSRLYDRQQHRLLPEEICHSNDELISRAVNHIANLPRDARKLPIAFENGAIQAFRSIEAAWRVR